MRNIRSVFIFVLFAALIGCGEQEITKQENAQVQAPIEKVVEEPVLKDTVTHELTVDHFNEIPAAIEGCSCFFSASKERFDKREYLFAAGFDSIAVMFIDQRIIELKLVSSTKEPGTFGTHDHTDIYSGSQFKVKVDIKFRKSNGAETWWNDGTITVERADGRKVIKKFVGECGC